MEIKKISIETKQEASASTRPSSLDDFIGQEEIKRILHTAIASAKQRHNPL